MPKAAPSPKNKINLKCFLGVLKKLLMASISWSKTLSTTAIVPPLTPGIILAIPINIPFKKDLKNYSFKFSYCLKYTKIYINYILF